jgi:hypothetical protein
MNRNLLTLLIAGLALAQAMGAETTPPPATQPAAVPSDLSKLVLTFPGAEGFGCDTPGGRGGKVIIVTNLNPDGPGSLQEACATPGPRIVAFAVSGVISNTITIEHSNITIAGQTSPGAGITIEGMLAANPGLSNLVIRFIRVRPRTCQEMYPAKGQPDNELMRRLERLGYVDANNNTRRYGPGDEHDSIRISHCNRVVLDHVSCSWSTDELLEGCGTTYATLQWCTFEETATNGHLKYRGMHNFGPFFAYNDKGAFVSFHHNLFANSSRRCPSVRDGQADLRNNVVYNTRGGFDHDGGCASTGTPHDYNYIGNYFKRGPNSKGDLAGVSWGRKTWWAEFRNETRDNRGKSFYFVEDNLWDDQPAPLPPYVEDGTVRLKEPMPAPAVTTHKAVEAYELVLKNAGAWPRDAVTKRTIQEVRDGTGDYGRREPKGGLMEGLTPGVAPKDTDRDGMPDEWEKKNGLDPTKDDSVKVMPSGYTAIEVYVNELAHDLVTKR